MKRIGENGEICIRQATNSSDRQRINSKQDGCRQWSTTNLPIQIYCPALGRPISARCSLSAGAQANEKTSCANFVPE
jgi:hypothetical protein